MAAPSDIASQTGPNPYWPFALASALVAAILVSGAIPGLWSTPFFDEGGPLETASWPPYLIGALGFMLIAPRYALGRAWHVTLLLFLFAARELDWDKAFTDAGILQTELYRGDYPATQQVIGGLIVLTILAMAYRFVRHGTGPLIKGLRARRLWAWTGLAAFATVVATKNMDGISRKLAPYGIELSEGVSRAFEVSEETGELALAVLLVLSLCAWIALKRTE